MIVVGFCLGVEAELCRVAEAFAELESERSDGRTRRKFLQSISSAKDVRDELAADQPSDRARYLWEWYIEIRSASANGMTNSITWAVLKEWSAIMQVNIKPWEARTLILMDTVMRSTAEKFKLKPKKEKK